MNQFEKKYYDASAFWENSMLTDPLNVERFKTTSSLIPENVASLVDIGCGNGVFVNMLLEKKGDMRIVGLDRSEVALKHVKTESIAGDISNLPFENDSFDCVTCLEVIEHLPIDAYQTSLREITRISKKYVIISVPFNEVLEDSYTKCPNCKSIFNCELHLRNYTEESFQNVLNGYGFKNVEIKKAGVQSSFKFHKQFRKIFYPEQFQKWTSPICPICGYEELHTADAVKKMPESVNTGSKSIKTKLISSLTAIPKLIWPMDHKYYWIIGLYEKR